MPKPGYIYVLASGKNGRLYVGVTSDLIKRVWEHKHDVREGFTERYGVHRLVYYERHESIRDAIEREKRIKNWKREWKIDLIEGLNPTWEDLYEELIT